MKPVTTPPQRILIAEDDVSILKMTKVRLEHEGFIVSIAADGEAVLAQTSDSDVLPHLILLDIRMPKLNGYEVCRELKRRPATAKIPVIVFTASESQLQHLANRCIEVGAVDWIKKPFRTQELMAKIHHALDVQEEHS